MDEGSGVAKLSSLRTDINAKIKMYKSANITMYKKILTFIEGYFGPKVWGFNTKYRRVIWRCKEKYKGGKKCSIPHIIEDEIKEKFVGELNKMLKFWEEITANCRLA